MAAGLCADRSRSRLRGAGAAPPARACRDWVRVPLDAKRSASLSYVAEVASRLGETESAARIYELMSGYST